MVDLENKHDFVCKSANYQVAFLTMAVGIQVYSF